MSCNCDTCYIPGYYAEEACSDDDKRGCNMKNNEKTICPHYDEDYICDCPYGVDMHPIGVCPPAEQIKDNLFEAWLDMKREREQSDKELEQLDKINDLEAKIEDLKSNTGWNR